MNDHNSLSDDETEPEVPAATQASSPVAAEPKTRLISHEELIETLREWWGDGKDDEDDEDDEGDEDDEDDEDLPPEDPAFREPVDMDLAQRTAFMVSMGYERWEACNSLGVPSTQYYDWVKLWKQLEAERGPLDFDDDKDDL